VQNVINESDAWILVVMVPSPNQRLVSTTKIHADVNGKLGIVVLIILFNGLLLEK